MYGSDRKAQDYGERFITEHGLEECFVAKKLVTNLLQIDRLLMVEKTEGFINWVTTEYLCRECYGLEEAFRKVRCKKDWCRMDSGKNFKSKVDWEAGRRIDPALVDHHRLRVKPVEEEIQKERERDALFLKTRAKLEEADRGHDPLNP